MNLEEKMELKGPIRKTTQFEFPVKKGSEVSEYNIYPTHEIGMDQINYGYDSLAEILVSSRTIRIDGYVGVRFLDIKEELNTAFKKKGIEPVWINVESALKDEQKIEELIAPFLGGDDPVFGKLCDLHLIDFFKKEALVALVKKASAEPIIFYGIGAALVPVDGEVVFFELSKNEIQFRSRAGSITNLGATQACSSQSMYKRFYFVDWPVLNNHKKELTGKIDFLVDGQRSENITWIKGNDWRESINTIVEGPLRARPWFSPGAWGGHWIKDKIKGLSDDVVNYAWSFELIVPENGIIIESNGYMLEFSFDFLMFHAGKEILGNDFEVYKYEFPIRFDFLDTVEGGNLSIQCHPQKEYMKRHFGENITQEETYYILDKKDDAHVYLGFQENISPVEFRRALETSFQESKEIEITQYVQKFNSQKHGLYLIPPGTIHSSGKNNLVLEISSTPYIYTFKMYDWQRLDLDGKPRPLNIERGMANLVFERAGTTVEEELISRPLEVEANENWILEHLPTHKEHLYDVNRYTVYTSVTINTSGKAHVLNVVEGKSIEVISGSKSVVYHYAETFLVPAQVKEYSLKNSSERPVKVILAFVK
ncbi:class I mannose-6-phosphate isomerase [Salinimicrobium sp. GXAS 041]|uniref:class I mannose-6-phosphate isomerase n=1 Tax=Salinimicrobium sp. GXAS 041 TaxID=3400806 RepID=UPI003C712ACE